MGKIAAGYVIYNPEDIGRLHKSIESVLSQVERVYIFDNGKNGVDYSFPEQVTVIAKNKNWGIAYALNRIFELAKKDGFEWVLTMDQDSILPVGIVDAYYDNISEADEIGIICPQIIDSRRSYMQIKKDPAKEYVDFCITSGSCTNIDIWEKVGRFDEWLFIDLVDNDLCKRMIASGYRILRLNSFVLDQEFGKIIPKDKKTQEFWNRIARLLHNENFAKFGYRKFVSPMRVYYTCRNVIYVNRKLKAYGKTGYRDNYNCNGFAGFLISFIAPSILRAQKPLKVTKAAIKGLADGIKKKPEVWTAKGRTSDE